MTINDVNSCCDILKKKEQAEACERNKATVGLLLLSELKYSVFTHWFMSPLRKVKAIQAPRNTHRLKTRC